MQHGQKGLSLIEILVTLSVVLIVLSSFTKTNKHLESIKAKKLCTKIEAYLYTLRFIAELQDTETILTATDTAVLGIASGKTTLTETFGKKQQIKIRSGTTGLQSIHFYEKNTASPGLIEVISSNTTYCALSISLRGRIKKIKYE